MTYQIQQMYGATPSIETLVVGLPVNTSSDPDGAQALLNFANAGGGQPVVPAVVGGNPMNLYYECDESTYSQDGGPYSWLNLLAASGKTGNLPIASYSTTGGTAPSTRRPRIPRLTWRPR